MDCSKYETKLKFPRKNDYTTLFIYSKGKVVGSYNLADPKQVKQSEEVLKELGNSTVKEFVVDNEGYANHVKEYREDRNRLYMLFKHDLEVENGVVGNPKAGMLYNKVWEIDDSSLSAVAELYNELVDLIK